MNLTLPIYRPVVVDGWQREAANDPSHVPGPTVVEWPTICRTNDESSSDTPAVTGGDKP